MRPPDQISTAHRPGRDAGDAGDAGDARPRASSTSLAGGAQSVGIGGLAQYTVGPLIQRQPSVASLHCSSARCKRLASPMPRSLYRHRPIRKPLTLPACKIQDVLPLSHLPLTPKPLRAARAAQPRRGERTPAPQVLRNPTRNVATTLPNSPTPVDNKHLSPDTPCASTPCPAWSTTNSLVLLVFFQGPQPDAVRR
jgi:hypothetical protein